MDCNQLRYGLTDCSLLYASYLPFLRLTDSVNELRQEHGAIVPHKPARSENVPLVEKCHKVKHRPLRH